MATHQSEIWNQTQCLNSEQQTYQRIFDVLTKKNFTQINFNKWVRNNQTVIVCLVDDIVSCATDQTYKDFPYMFDSRTTVITDNKINSPTLFKLLTVPSSFFGIYSYIPSNQIWEPDKEFSFSVNRVNPVRITLFLDLSWRTRLNYGYVNFNCQDRENPSLSANTIFENHWQIIVPQDKLRLEESFKKYATSMPFKNYDVEFDMIANKSWINMVVETYNQNHSIALSEKIFRALVTPAPWTLFSGRYTVAYLESLGFDCVSDMIDHNYYDRLEEDESKVEIFNHSSLKAITDLKEIGIDEVRKRYLIAAQHNQMLLYELNRCWSKEFSHWLDNLSKLF